MKFNNLIITSNPWLAPEVTNFIKELLDPISSPNVLEFGSGCSTIFFTNLKLLNLISIEHNPIWFKSVQDYINAQGLEVDLRLVTNHYYEECYKFAPDFFDFILLDGKDRMACLQAIRDLNILKPGGVVMLDDADMRDKYQVADEIMQTWQKVELSGWKQNPLHLNDEPVFGVTKCWFRPKI